MGARVLAVHGRDGQAHGAVLRKGLQHALVLLTEQARVVFLSLSMFVSLFCVFVVCLFYLFIVIVLLTEEAVAA